MVFSEISAFSGVYFIGIGGVSMSALALCLADRGFSVRGSDAQESSFTQKLRGKGIPVSIGEDEEISEGLVVVTGAILPEHRQLRQAESDGKKIVSRAELLGAVAGEFPHVVSVAGCHGKTTTSCMLAHILRSSGKPFVCHIGGEDADFGNYHCEGREYFVTEACEFKRSFLELKSEIGVVLNCDRDHTDCYKTKAELLSAYREFAAKSKYAVVNADDVGARSISHVLSFGMHNGDVRATSLRCDREVYAFTVEEKGIPFVRIRLNVVGIFNVMNALAAYACARLLGLSAEEIRGGLESFHGVKRRFERVGTFCGVPLICDYAHHPREIAATLYTARRIAEGKVRLVFQPHTYTRTRDLMTDFIDALSTAESPVVYSTYAAREKYDYEGSAARLTAMLPSAVYISSPERLSYYLKSKVRPKDMVLVLGAGNIYDIAKSIADKK